MEWTLSIAVFANFSHQIGVHSKKYFEKNLKYFSPIDYPVIFWSILSTLPVNRVSLQL